ncbi:MAG: carboxypeptidase-like regulatory domain-containing protein [Butyricimonas faecihominis]
MWQWEIYIGRLPTQEKSDTTKEIKGKAVDSKGETVIGATVRVVNATIGTATDIDGNFTLRVRKT